MSAAVESKMEYSRTYLQGLVLEKSHESSPQSCFEFKSLTRKEGHKRQPRSKHGLNEAHTSAGRFYDAMTSQNRSKASHFVQLTANETKQVEDDVRSFRRSNGKFFRRMPVIVHSLQSKSFFVPILSTKKV